MKHLLNRRGVWISNLLLVAGLVLVAVLATLFEQLFGVTANPDIRIAVSVIVALLPPILWLVLFYGLDRVEPEPKEQILKMALLGALVQKGIFAPLLAALPAADTVSGFPKSVSAFAGILLLVAIREILKLMTLRYGMMGHEAFNEKTDGILYGSAIGLGFSAAMNLEYITSTGGALLSSAAPQMVITSLVQASLGGLGGYWLGLAVFSRQPRWRLPLYLACLVLLSGVMQFLPAILVRQGFKVNYLIGLIPSAVASLAIFLVLILLIRRHGTLTIGLHADRKTRYEGIVLGVVLLLVLATALSLKIWQERLVPVSSFKGATISIPADWSDVPEDGILFAAGDRFDGSAKSGAIRIAVFPDATDSVLSGTGNAAGDGALPTDGIQADGEDAVHVLAAWWTMKSARDAAFYKPVRTEFLFRDGQWLAVIESLRLEASLSDTAGHAPIVRLWRDVAWLQGADVAVVSLYGTQEDGIPDLRLMDKIVASLHFGSVQAKGGDAE